MAPDAELARHYAREMYGRRQESERLWIVRRADIGDLHDMDLLQPPLDRSYKKPGGYVMRDKLAAARARTGPGQAEGARGMTEPTAGPPSVRRPTSARREREALGELLLALADDELVIGYWDSEWTGIAPMLEEDVAMTSLATDELGHARAFYTLLGELDRSRPRRDRLRPSGRGVPARPDRRPSADRLGVLDRPALAVRHRRRGPARGARRVVVPRRWPSSSPRSGARSATTCCTSTRGCAGWRAATPSRAAHLERAWTTLVDDGPSVFAPLPGEAALVDAGILPVAMDELAERWIAEARRGRHGARPGPAAAVHGRRPGPAAGSTTRTTSAGSGRRSRRSAGSTRRPPGDAFG